MTEALTVQTPLDLIAQATMDKDVDADKLEKLLAVQQQWDAGEARKAYARAMGQFQARMPIIAKEDDAYGKKYARMDRIWRTIQPLMGELGLWVTWEQALIEGKLCKIRGTIGHTDGHTVTLANDIPLPSLLKQQNEAQQAGSAQTYAKRYALCAALGIVTGDDDDGNGGVEVVITSAQKDTLVELIEATDTNTKTFCAIYGMSCVDNLPAVNYKAALAMLKKKQKVAQ